MNCNRAQIDDVSMFWCHSCYTQTIRKGQSRDPLDLGLADDGGWRDDQESLKNLGRSGVESRCVNKYSSGSVSGPNFHLDGSITSSHAGVFWYLDGARQDTDENRYPIFICSHHLSFAGENLAHPVSTTKSTYLTRLERPQFHNSITSRCLSRDNSAGLEIRL